MRTFRPINNNVLLEPEPFAEQSGAGLWLPQPKRDQGLPRTAKVIAVGPGKMVTEETEAVKIGHSGIPPGVRIKPQVRPGDRVYYLHFRGQDRYAQPEKYGEKYLLIDADDILAVIE